VSPCKPSDAISGRGNCLSVSEQLDQVEVNAVAGCCLSDMSNGRSVEYGERCTVNGEAGEISGKKEQ
jgi:hypothetical protein